MVWDLVALYAPASQTSADAFNRGVAALRDGKKLDAMVQPYRPAVPKTSIAPGGAASSESTHRSYCATPEKKQRAKPKPPAIYTEAQATQGKVDYFQNCSMCHGALLDGQRGGYPGPALKGADFADPSYDFHVDEIFRFVAKLMPAANPGTLSNDQNVAIMAFILQENGYPSGATELTYEGAMKSRVPIRYYGQ
jgi:polar amino acid transport system substrate-binding protein